MLQRSRATQDVNDDGFAKSTIGQMLSDTTAHAALLAEVPRSGRRPRAGRTTLAGPLVHIHFESSNGVATVGGMPMTVSPVKINGVCSEGNDVVRDD
jgi:hypothetical protein